MTPRSDKFKKVIQWALAVACTAYIVHFFATNTDKLKLVMQLNPLAIGAIAVFSILGHLIFCVRFQIVLKKCSGKSVPFFPWFRIVILGRFLTLLAPQAGNIYRSIALKKHYQIPHTRYASSFFSFIWMDACVNLLLTLAIVAIVEPGLMIGRLRAVLLLAVSIVAIVAAPLLIEAVFGLFSFKNKKLGWLHSKIAEMLRVSVSNLRDARFMLKVFVTGVVGLGNTLAIFYLCFRCLDLPIKLPTLALFFMIMRLSTHIAITPGNLGVREIAYGIVSDQMNFGMAQGILISVIIRVIGTAIIIVLGTIFGGIGLLQHREEYVPAVDEGDS